MNPTVFLVISGFFNRTFVLLQQWLKTYRKWHWEILFFSMRLGAVEKLVWRTRSRAEENMVAAKMLSVGTVMYMAPEVLAATRESKIGWKQADIYSLDMNMWEIVTRRWNLNVFTNFHLENLFFNFRKISKTNIT